MKEKKIKPSERMATDRLMGAGFQCRQYNRPAL